MPWREANAGIAIAIAWTALKKLVLTPDRRPEAGGGSAEQTDGRNSQASRKVQRPGITGDK